MEKNKIAFEEKMYNLLHMFATLFLCYFQNMLKQSLLFEYNVLLGFLTQAPNY